jgi:hypothetical protein
MTDDPESLWDDTVDVVCVGSGPGVLAYAICCAAVDLDVMMVGPSAASNPELDAWRAAMTEDLNVARRLDHVRDSNGNDCPTFSFARVTPAPVRVGKGVTLEPFIGEHLRQWSASCLRSPLGVMFTEVPELLIPMCTEDGATITAAFLGDLTDGDVLTWLADRALETGVPEPGHAMSALILEQGRIAGVELDDGTRVAATGGLAFAVDAPALVPDVPGLGGCTVALVGRPAGRFATVDLLYR